MKPSLKATQSLFNIRNESVLFEGLTRMSPFDFDSFTCTLGSTQVNTVKVGVRIVKESMMETQTVYLNCRTRLIHLQTIDSGFVSKEDDNQLETIRNQRYTKEVFAQ